MPYFNTSILFYLQYLLFRYTHRIIRIKIHKKRALSRRLLGDKEIIKPCQNHKRKTKMWFPHAFSFLLK